MTMATLAPITTSATTTPENRRLINSLELIQAYARRLHIISAIEASHRIITGTKKHENAVGVNYIDTKYRVLPCQISFVNSDSGHLKQIEQAVKARRLACITIRIFRCTSCIQSNAAQKCHASNLSKRYQIENYYGIQFHLKVHWRVFCPWDCVLFHLMHQRRDSCSERESGYMTA